MVMSIGDIRLDVVFFQTESGTEPVRKWLKALSDSHKKARKIPHAEIATARSRLKQYLEAGA